MVTVHGVGGGHQWGRYDRGRRVLCDQQSWFAFHRDWAQLLRLLQSLQGRRALCCLKSAVTLDLGGLGWNSRRACAFKEGCMRVSHCARGCSRSAQGESAPVEEAARKLARCMAQVEGWVRTRLHVHVCPAEPLCPVRFCTIQCGLWGATSFN